MAGTIYGGTTINGVIIQDMIDDSRDLIYRNNKLSGFFARLAQSLLREDDTERCQSPKIFPTNSTECLEIAKISMNRSKERQMN